MVEASLYIGHLKCGHSGLALKLKSFFGQKQDVGGGENAKRETIARPSVQRMAWQRASPPEATWRKTGETRKLENVNSSNRQLHCATINKGPKLSESCMKQIVFLLKSCIGTNRLWDAGVEIFSWPFWWKWWSVEPSAPLCLLAICGDKSASTSVCKRLSCSAAAMMAWPGFQAKHLSATPFWIRPLNSEFNRIQ